MELIRISNRKLKIMLTAADMCHFELNAESLEDNQGQMRKAFRLLLEEIRKRTDFDADDRRLAVQYFPSREGGCEMFISQLQEESGEGQKESPASTKALQLRSARQNSVFRRDCAYGFDRLSDLLAVCSRLKAMGYIGESSAYRSHHGVYYLFLCINAASPFATPDEWSFIAEYGRIENPTQLRIYIAEYGLLLCEEYAVEQLGDLE